MPRSVDYQETIRNLIEEYGTQSGLAESMGLHPDTVRRHKNGEISVTGETLKKYYRRGRYYDALEYEEDKEPPPPPEPFFRTVVSGSFESKESGSAAEIIAWRVTRAPGNVAEVVAHWEQVRREVAQEIPMVMKIDPENKEENEPIMPAQIDNRGKIGEMQEVVIVFNGYSSYEYTGGLESVSYGYPQQDL